MTITIPISLAADTGSSNIDHYTNNPDLFIDFPGGSYNVFINGNFYVSFGAGPGLSYAPNAGAFADGHYVYEVVAQDASQYGSITFDLDTQQAAPAAPDLDAASDTGFSNSDDKTTDTTPTFTGTADLDATVKIFDGATELGTTTADSVTGNWSFTPSSPLALSSHSITATAVDLAGNQSGPSAALDIIVDDGQTSLTTIIPISLDNDTGPSNTDHFTSDPALLLNFPGLPGGVFYHSYLDGNDLSQGDFTAGGLGIDPLGSVADGLHTYEVRTTDGSQYGSITFDLDTQPPATPSAPDLDAASDTGVSNSDDKTSDISPTFTGTTDPDAIVKIFDGATELGTTTSDSVTGNWSFTPSSPLALGSHSITATVTDLAGNEAAAASNALDILVDDGQTSQTTIIPISLGTDTGSSASDHYTNDPGVITDYPGGTYNRFINGAFSGSSSNGNFPSFTFNSQLEDGHYVYEIVEVDGSQYGSITFDLDRQAPATPSAPDLDAASDTGLSDSDDKTSDTTPTFTGTVGADETVTIFDGSTVLGTTVADSVTGNWSFTQASALAFGSHSITATAVDLAGNESETASSALTIFVDDGDHTPVIDLDTASDNGADTTDNLTSLHHLSFTIQGQPGSSMLVGYQVNGIGVFQQIGAGPFTADSNGVVQVSADFVDGQYTIEVSETDEFGHIKNDELDITVGATGVVGGVGKDSLTGDDGDNYLDGGLDRDRMTGGGGSDTYIVDNKGDKVIELLNQGDSDTVYSSVSYKLPGNVENLTLTGTANINGGGNKLDNVITGNSGDNVLKGDQGNDTFVFGAGFGHDTIKDFQGQGALPGDMIEFDSSVFADFAAVQAAIVDNGSTITIHALDGDSITLKMKDASHLDASDFLFV